MRWFQRLWPSRWFASSKRIEDCETADELLEAIEKQVDGFTKDPYRIEVRGRTKLGLAVAWIPLLCGLNPLMKYSSKEETDILLMPVSKDEYAIFRRVIASIYVMLDLCIFLVSGLGSLVLWKIEPAFLLMLAIHLASFTIGSIAASVFGFRLHPHLREKQSLTSKISFKNSVHTFIERRMKSARELLLGESSVLLAEIQKNNEVIWNLESKRSLFRETLAHGSVIAEEMIEKIDEGIRQFRAKSTILQNRVDALRELFNKVEARIQTVMPRFDERELVIATQQLLTGADEVYADISRIDAHLLTIIRHEFGLMDRVISAMTQRAYAIPLQISAADIHLLTDRTSQSDIAFQTSMSEIAETLMCNPLHNERNVH